MIKRAALILLLLASPVISVRADTPLLMEGKQTLFQRVLMRSAVGARDAPAGAVVAQVRALDPYFVYERAGGEGETWLRLASGVDGEGAFWAKESETIPWRQNIILTFTTLGELERLLIFEKIDDIYTVIESEDPAYDASILRQQAAAAEAARKSGEQVEAGAILALGPSDGVDFRKQFYMLPILEAEEAVFDTGGFVNLLKIAVAKSGAPEREVAIAPKADRTEALKQFSVGVAFVVDTTRSMGLYFGEVRDAVGSVFEAVNESDVGGRFSFALVGFRDHVDRPGVEYLAKTFVDLQQGKDRAVFLAGLDSMQEAEASTKGFNEDSFAGVAHALDQLDWDGFDARMIILLTDAGPREANDPLSATSMSARGLANYAQEVRRARIAVMHLKTDKGQSTHDSAAAAYKDLTRAANVGELYYGVPGGDPKKLREAASALVGGLMSMAATAGKGQELNPEVEAADKAKGLETDQAALIKRSLQVAKAMQLDYLGAETGVDAPDVFEGWIADRDFAKQGLKPIDVRLLVTRNQLSDLGEALENIVIQGEETGLEPTNFFAKVVAAAAEMSRRPDQVAAHGGQSLADASLIGEYLEGLPYRSQVMSIDERTWLAMSISEQQELLDLMAEKLERYDAAIRGSDNWILLNPADEPGDAVYPMPLEDLP